MNDELFDAIGYANNENQKSRMIAQAGMYSERFFIPEKYARTVRILANIMGKNNYFSMEDVDDNIKAMLNCTSKIDLEQLLLRCERVRLLDSYTHENIKTKRGSHKEFSLTLHSAYTFVNLLLLFGDYVVKDHYNGPIRHDNPPISIAGKLFDKVLNDSYADFSLYNLIEIHTKGKPIFVDRDNIYYATGAIGYIKHKVVDDIIVNSPVFKDSRIKDLPMLFDMSIIMHADMDALISHDRDLNHMDDKLVRKGNTYILDDIVTIDLDENKNNLLLQ